MKHYLFECIDEDSVCDGEEFIVGASTIEEAKEIAIDNFEIVKYICELSDYEAEMSGLDEY